MNYQNGLSKRDTTRRFDLGLRMEGNEREEREARIRAILHGDDEDDLLGKAYDGRLMRRLFRFLVPYKMKLYLAIVLMVISSLLSVAGPTIVGRAVDDGIRAGDFATL
ncbi:MAG: hypothetical protein KDE56_32805, partial [Anaerolineales bacterium]|nr:hypothetical protein [Anaerolineales bacterium]